MKIKENTLMIRKIRVAVPSGNYDPQTQTVNFTLHHFSLYTVAFVEKTFDGMAKFPWAKSPVEVLASKGIISGDIRRDSQEQDGRYTCFQQPDLLEYCGMLYI